MNKRMIKALILSAALGWAVLVVAQDIRSETDSQIEFGPLTEIYRASILRQLLWAGVALINPSDQYIPVPLYGYALEGDGELDDETIGTALREAAEGNVHIAVLNPLGDGSSYAAQGVRVVPNGEGVFEMTDEMTDEMEELRNRTGAGGLIAFTRPLNSTTIEHAGITEAEEFIALPNLWGTSLGN